MDQPATLGRLISALYRHQMAILNRRFASLGLGGGSYIFLIQICEHPGLTQSELSRNLLIDKATVSKMLAILEKRKLILRKPDPADRRAAFLYPTSKGLKDYETLIGISMIYRQEMTAGVTADEYEMLYHLLTKLLKNLCSVEKGE